jgi:hypothetical protein
VHVIRRKVSGASPTAPKKGHKPLRFRWTLTIAMSDFAHYSWWPVYCDALEVNDLASAEHKLDLAEEATLLRMLDPDLSIAERSALRDAITRLKQHRMKLKKTR